MTISSLRTGYIGNNVVAGNVVDYLVVGAGGAGGPNGRGGGAGGEVRSGKLGFNTNSVTITIGAGGTWAANLGRCGSASIFAPSYTSVTSLAGQDGGDPAGGTGQNGGANGGAYGNPSGTAGSNGTSSSITGSSVTYGGGGGGGSGGTSTNASGGTGGGGAGGRSTGGTATRTGTNGTANTGGGGGGAGNNASPDIGQASNGGSGIVILAYPQQYPPLTSIDVGLTYSYSTTSRSGFRVYSFTAGTGTVRF